MWLLIVEALAAFALLVFLVWWTMFSGRRRGERVGTAHESTGRHEPEAPTEAPPRDPPGTA